MSRSEPVKGIYYDEGQLFWATEELIRQSTRYLGHSYFPHGNRVCHPCVLLHKVDPFSGVPAHALVGFSNTDRVAFVAYGLSKDRGESYPTYFSEQYMPVLPMELLFSTRESLRKGDSLNDVWWKSANIHWNFHKPTLSPSELQAMKQWLSKIKILD